MLQLLPGKQTGAMLQLLPGKQTEELCYSYFLVNNRCVFGRWVPLKKNQAIVSA